jgi:transposase
VLVSSSDAGPGEVEGRVDPAARPTRRSFTAEYKARVVAEYEAAPHGEKSAVLRREGLFHSHVREWVGAGRVGADGPRVRPPRRDGRGDRDAARLRAENQRLTAKLAQTQAALAIMGKAHELLEMLAESSAPPTGSSR